MAPIMVVAVAVAMVGVRILSRPLGIQLDALHLNWSASIPGDYDRAALMSSLSSSPEHFLVIVRYAPDHNTNREWVYNEADLQQAKIIWARDLGPETDALVKHFSDRRAVVVEPDRNPRAVVPYQYQVATGPADVLRK